MGRSPDEDRLPALLFLNVDGLANFGASARQEAH